MKLDAHQHFWQYSPEAYGWITDALLPLKRDYLPEDLAPELARMGYDGCIAVQARQEEAENDFLLALADRADFIKGVVGWVDLQSPNVAERLAHYAQHPKFVGIRHIVQDEPDERFLLRPAFLDGIRKLADFGLTYDILVYERHLPVAIEFARQFPEQPFVLDHIAKPLIKQGTLEPWASNFRKLATLPNVLCKLSGMVTEADWNGWKKEDLLPYLETALEAFGADRLMIGSDWPVCRLAAEYDEAMGTVEAFISSLAPAEQAAVLGGNCARFYLGNKQATR